MVDHNHMPGADRLYFGTRLETLSGRLTGDIIDFLRKQGASDTMSDPGYGTYIPFREVKLSAAIQGSDQVSIGLITSLDIAPTGTDTPDRSISLELFNDGSPWVLEDDLDAHHDCQNRYAVISAPDMPPCMINATMLEEVTGGWIGNPSDLDRVVKQFGPQALHWLTDGDCTAVLDVIERASSFIDYESLAEQGN